MPISLDVNIRRLDQKQFGDLAYEVMPYVFRVHDELGRFFDEKIYQRELAFRIPGAQMEVPVHVIFEDFEKTYYLDLMVAEIGIFEFKTVDFLSPRHRGQLLNYLLMADVAHGKLVNLRTERVQHEFVNTSLTRAERTVFSVEDDRWQPIGTSRFKQWMTALLHDWGTALDTALYEEAASHFYGRRDIPMENVEVYGEERSLGLQPVRVIEPHIALRITALPAKSLPVFEEHLYHFLEHTSLRAVQWINVVPGTVRFTTVQKTEC